MENKTQKKALLTLSIIDMDEKFKNFTRNGQLACYIYQNDNLIDIFDFNMKKLQCFFSIQFYDNLSLKIISPNFTNQMSFKVITISCSELFKKSYSNNSEFSEWLIFFLFLLLIIQCLKGLL